MRDARTSMRIRDSSSSRSSSHLASLISHLVSRSRLALRIHVLLSDGKVSLCHSSESTLVPRPSSHGPGSALLRIGRPWNWWAPGVVPVILLKKSK